jgi:adenylosuccinate synthase
VANKLILDSSMGSSGKGRLAAFLATNDQSLRVAACTFAVQAGHVVVMDDGTKITTQCIPSSFVNKNVLLYLGPTCNHDIETITKEVKMLDDLGFEVSSRLLIHPLMSIIEQRDRDFEKSLIKSGSTFKGCGAAAARKITRDPSTKLARDVSDQLPGKIVDYTMQLIKHAKSGEVIGEVAQGFGLSLNHSGYYPNVTYRDVTPMNFFADVGIPTSIANTFEVVGNARTLPIRISNESAADGSYIYSGDTGGRELTWAEVENSAGYAPGELSTHSSNFTTVTKKLRRVFEFDWREDGDFGRFVNICDPTSISLNFVNHLCKDDAGVKDFSQLSDQTVEFILRLERTFSVPVKYIGTGAKHSETIVR